MDIRRLRWKALQTLWTVSRMTFLRPACCKTLPVSLSYSDQRLMYCPAGIVCSYTELALPCSIGEQRACIETCSVQSENIIHLSIGNGVFHSWQVFSIEGQTVGLISNFRKGGKRVQINSLFRREFYVLLTVHPGMILVNNQFDAQFFSCMFISILYMFRAAMCPSSGELLYQVDRAYQTVIYTEWYKPGVELIQ